MSYQWTRFDLYLSGMTGDEGLSSREDPDGEWVKAEEAIARESALLARIQQLEERAAQAAELVAKAVEVMAPKT